MPELIIGDNVRVYQALVIRKGLQACQQGFRLNRTYTPTNLTRTATRFTGKSYTRGKKGIQQAIDDMTVLIDKAESEGQLVEVGVDVSG